MGGLVPVTGRWSQPESWDTGSVPAAGESVEIVAGKTIVLDTVTAPLDVLEIHGTLIADPALDVGIIANSIAIMPGGTLEIGRPEAPYARRATITLTGARGVHVARVEDSALDNDGVSRGLRVLDGGTLRLCATTPPRLKTKLNEHAPAGATVLTVADPVQWQAGDQIAISLTDFYGVGQTEILTLAQDVAGTTLTLTTPLATARWGRLQYPVDSTVGGQSLSLTPGPFTPASPATPTVLDQRATIVNLTRRIVLQGANDAHWSGQGFGAHVMVMGLGSVAQVRGVEFRRCGQRRAMGRYPFHWHMLSISPADANGLGGGAFLGDAAAGKHFMQDCSVVDSENRAVTIHGTCGVTVDNVYAVGIKGHAFFLEDGSERRNTIANCVAMHVRDPGPQGRLKVHENANNHGGSSGFWITNPDNTVVGNSASDCGGRGLWNSFATRCFGLSRNHTHNPATTMMRQWDDNTGHSNLLEGMMTEFAVVNEAGNVNVQSYNPGAPFTMANNKVWKNRAGGYVNRVGAARYVNWTAADNNGRDFHGQTAGAVMTGALLICRSLNSATPFTDPRRIAVSSYHYQLDVINITALDYPFVGPTMTSNGAYVHGGGVFDSSDLYDRSVGLGGFRNSGWRLINSHPGYMTPPPYFDGFPLQVPNSNSFRYWSLPGAVWDPHGYWGPAGNYLIPDHPFYTFQLPSSVLVAPAGSNGRSTPHLFYGIGEIVLDEQLGHWMGPSLITQRCARLNDSNQQVAEHTIGNPSQSAFFNGMRSFSLAKGGRYRISFPDGQMPTTALRLEIKNAYRASDWVLLALPWPGNVPVGGRVDSGIDFASQASLLAAGKSRLYVRNANNISDVLGDPTGARIWQDTGSNLVWVKHVGGLVQNVPGFDGRSDLSLEQVYVIRLRVQP